MENITNTAMVFAIDDQSALLSNERHRLRSEMQVVLAKNDYNNRETICHLAGTIESLSKKISAMDKQRERYLC